MLRRIIDKLQVWLYLADFPKLAQFIGNFADASPEAPPQLPPVAIAATYAVSARPELPKSLKVLIFDPTYADNSSRGIDVAKDVAWPASKYDVN